MKGFVISLIILIIAGAAVFFLGWVQFHVDDDEYVVLFTKARGWEQETVYPGTFVWRWEGVFPTMLSRYHFPRRIISLEAGHRGALPAADLYSELMPREPSFQYSFESTLSFELKPDMLPRLAEESGLRPEGVEAYTAQLESAIEGKFPQYIADILQDSVSVTGGGAPEDGDDPPASGSSPEGEDSPWLTDILLENAELQEMLAEKIQEDIPEIRLVSFRIHDLELPDMEVYAAARERYRSIASAENLAREQAAGDIARIQLISQARKESLEELGDLLDTHPSLMEYLSLVASSGNDPLGLAPMFQEVLGGVSTPAGGPQ
ncbi:hypothetical protein [Salinispira pacifica]|uniref:Band 7 domain-containing protein n=1 Tax=Salinispira pacifica TaxID=1307761 RepID=V5WH38_9SPIO|nr:hypothetical protein [Salinispira pacifica]AHC15137.1 hypothetical protein L21SP2_1760 [Salinispira pacifica]